MRHLAFTHADGSVSAIPVNGMSTVHVQTWTPPVFGEGGVAPVLVEDQTVALNDVVQISYSDQVSADAVVLSGGGASQAVEPISEAEAMALEASYETAVNPWDAD